MSKRKSFAESWDALVARHAKSKGGSSTGASFQLLSDIRLRPEVFQHRKLLQSASDAHVRELTRGAKQTGALEPITVWWDGRNYVCIDGHHRIRAYRAAGMSNQQVPVTFFSGNPEQALAEAARGNTRDKLKMSTSEKTSAAWRMVMVGGEATKAAIADASGASPRTVANMRRVFGVLTARGEDCKALAWEAARRLEAGDDREKTDWDDEVEVRAQEMATQITKAIGREGSKQPHALARALELYDPRLPDILLEQWGHGSEE